MGGMCLVWNDVRPIVRSTLPIYKSMNVLVESSKRSISEPPSPTFSLSSQMATPTLAGTTRGELLPDVCDLLANLLGYRTSSFGGECNERSHCSPIRSPTSSQICLLLQCHNQLFWETLPTIRCRASHTHLKATPLCWSIFGPCLSHHADQVSPPTQQQQHPYRFKTLGPHTGTVDETDGPDRDNSDILRVLQDARWRASRTNARDGSYYPQGVCPFFFMHNLFWRLIFLELPGTEVQWGPPTAPDEAAGPDPLVHLPSPSQHQPGIR